MDGGRLTFGGFHMAQSCRQSVVEGQVARLDCSMKEIELEFLAPAREGLLRRSSSPLVCLIELNLLNPVLWQALCTKILPF